MIRYNRFNELNWGSKIVSNLVDLLVMKYHLEGTYIFFSTNLCFQNDFRHFRHHCKSQSSLEPKEKWLIIQSVSWMRLAWFCNEISSPCVLKMLNRWLNSTPPLLFSFMHESSTSASTFRRVGFRGYRS